MFQKQDGVDILLLVMYVNEYDDTRRVSIAYLDTVNYFDPKKLVAGLKKC